MKKILVVFLMALLAIELVGCSWFGIAGDNSSISANAKNTVIVNFHDNDNVKSEQLKIGEEYKAYVPVKSGYYLTGYYSEPTGGKRYFDELGRSISVWSENYPTDVYAQWASVSGMMIYNIYNPEKTYTGGPGMDSSIGILFSIEEFPAKLVSGNLDRDVVVNISYRIYEEYTSYYPITKQSVKIKDGKGSSADVLFSTSYDFACGSYQQRFLTFSCEARRFCSGYLFFYVSSNSGYLFDEIAIKDFTLTAEFV